MIKFLDPRITVKQPPSKLSEHKMKLFNVIVVYDTYVVAETPAAAREAVMQWLKEDPSSLIPEETAFETREENNVRDSWREQKPLVGADVSDDDFEKRVKGKTTIEIFKNIYTKTR